MDTMVMDRFKLTFMHHIKTVGVALCVYWDVLTVLRNEQYAGTNKQAGKFPCHQFSGKMYANVTVVSATPLLTIKSSENEWHENID